MATAVQVGIVVIVCLVLIALATGVVTAWWPRRGGQKASQDADDDRLAVIAALENEFTHMEAAAKDERSVASRIPTEGRGARASVTREGHAGDEGVEVGYGGPEVEALYQEADEGRRTPLRSVNLMDLLKADMGESQGFYRITKTQSQLAFRFALATGLLGALILLAGVAASLLDVAAADLDQVAIASGVTLDAVAGLVFVFQRRASAQAARYHDRLMALQETLIAIHVVNQISTPIERDRAYAAVAFRLMKIPAAD